MKAPNFNPESIKNTIAGIFMIFAFACICSCEKTELDFIDAPTPQSEPTIAHNPNINTNRAFAFSLALRSCFEGGANASVSIKDAHLYTFQWETNGKYIGSSSSSISPCLCGRSARVVVTRIADGAKVSRSFGLPYCEVKKVKEDLSGGPLQNSKPTPTNTTH